MKHNSYTKSNIMSVLFCVLMFVSFLTTKQIFGLRFQSEYRKIWTRKTLNTTIFHTVCVREINYFFNHDFTAV